MEEPIAPAHIQLEEHDLPVENDEAENHQEITSSELEETSLIDNIIEQVKATISTETITLRLDKSTDTTESKLVVTSKPSQETENSPRTDSGVKNSSVPETSEPNIKHDCLSLTVTAKDISSSMIESLINNQDFFVDTLPKHLEKNLQLKVEEFFINASKQDLLNSYGWLKIFYERHTQTISEDAFWLGFVWFCHYKIYVDRNTPPPEEVIPVISEKSEEEALLEEDNGPKPEVIKLDYHSVNRYIASAILSFLKVFLVCAVLNAYDAPWYFYMYPALWVVIGVLICVRALMIQRRNNQLAAKALAQQETGVEMHELESV
jgi:hypothetical protein